MNSLKFPLKWENIKLDYSYIESTTRIINRVKNYY